jgi:CRP/FNR family transcriptional regulator
MDVKIEFLQSIPYYSGLSPAELESIRRFTFETAAQKGEVVLLEGETSEKLYFVVSGVMKIFKTSANGKEQILQIVRPGESVNEVPIFDGGVNPVSAQAMTPVVLYSIKRSDLETAFREHPQIARNVIKVLAGRIRRLMALIEDLSFKPVVSRVAKILLEQVADETGPRPRLTQQEMAALAGTAREMVGRSLKTLEESQAIRLDRHRIIITNKQVLQETAGVSG